MKVFFQKKKIIFHTELKKFSSKNKFSGSISSFLGKVRPHRNRTEIQFLEIGIDAFPKLINFSAS